MDGIYRDGGGLLLAVGAEVGASGPYSDRGHVGVADGAWLGGVAGMGPSLQWVGEFGPGLVPGPVIDQAGGGQGRHDGVPQSGRFVYRQFRRWPLRVYSGQE